MLFNMFKKIKGKKTYAAAIAAVLTGLAAYFSGDATFMEAAQLVATGLIGAFLRNAV